MFKQILFFGKSCLIIIVVIRGAKMRARNIRGSKGIRDQKGSRTKRDHARNLPSILGPKNWSITA
jgi:hypothetical protein